MISRRALLTLPLLACRAARAPSAPQLTVRAQTGEEAFAYAWQQLRDMPFYRANEYEVGMPSSAGWTAAADAGDREAARRAFLDADYRPDDFRAGLAATSPLPARLGPIWTAFADWQRRWGFELRPSYTVLLTLYGPGGSYDPDTATITMRTSPDGHFKTEPFQNVVHEMVHLGIERTVVRRFALSHQEKERLVDRICIVAFGALLPDYRMQPFGPPALDAHIDAAALDDLPAAIARYQASQRRTL